MALTNQQLLSLGFKPSVRGRGGLSKTKKYDSLVLALNDTDFLYTGFNPYKNQVNYKTIWKSFKDSDGNRITYQVINLADTGFTELKQYISRSNRIYLNTTEYDPIAVLHSEAFIDTTPPITQKLRDEVIDVENNIEVITDSSIIDGR